LTYCLSSVVLYFSVVVLVIVNAQPTTDDDDIDDRDVVDKDEIAELREELAKVRGELAKAVGRIGNLEDELAAAVEKIDTKRDASKLNTVTLITLSLYQCALFVDLNKQWRVQKFCTQKQRYITIVIPVETQQPTGLKVIINH